MKKIQKYKRIYVGFMIFAMLAMTGFLPPLPRANAIDAITDAKDTISDSDLGATANHVISFVTASTTEIGYYIDVVFHSDFSSSTLANVTCPDAGVGWTKSLETPSEKTVRCTATAQNTGSTNTITVNGVVNPSSAGDRTIIITHYNDSAVVIERATAMVFVIDDVVVTATVSSTLDFTISGTTTAARVNGNDCDVDTSGDATTLPFGNLDPTSSTTLCQDLSVTTNADDGYSVTVEQSDELRSDSNSTINSFNNAPDTSGSTTPVAWTAPTAQLGNEWTYGHMGLTTNDSTNIAEDYTGNKWAGLNGYNTPTEVMTHTGPSDGVTQNAGRASVAYKIQISALQEAGDYESTLTYIVTPQY